ncbi:isoleucine--tRNA ligase [bacterium]|nr:isoleucine--tRNA ligase [bacterium]
MKLNLPKIEKEVLEFWEEKKIFERSLEKTKKGKRFVFFEGPPYANGLPGIHHLLARAFKDIILRYKTMQGFFVERRAGWDTHGLPTETAAEKSLGIKDKKGIEKIGIEKFIKECKKDIFTYKKEWEEFTKRIGFWIDLENPYITCDNEYIESLWWILKQIWEAGLLYQDYRVVPYCPRCGTSLASHEVAQGYKRVKENSIYVKFKIKGEENSYFLAWTTTPWTLPANVALAVNPDFLYVKIKTNSEYLILAKERLSTIDGEYEIVDEFKGESLMKKEYEPLFDFEKLDKKAYYMVLADFVSLEEGTGIVHIAPAFGEEDMEVMKENDLPMILNVDESGRFKEEVKDWQGLFVKEADPKICQNLRERNLLYKEELYEHEYPFCWRCKTPLLYYAKNSWFIKMSAQKERLIENNKKINWVPDYIKEGRFGEWLREIKDWNLSRERYWGAPLPIWECQKCGKKVCIGSLKELREKSETKIDNLELHRPFVDKITLKCDCGGEMKRVLEVIDCWFDSGAMPFAQWHYPFENRERVDEGEFFPADFICEGMDQTRGWFYTLLAVSTLLKKGAPYKNVICVGLVLDEKGQKMSKSKGNVVFPNEVIEKFGSDCARFYFYTINQVGEAKRFSFKEVENLYRRFFDTLWNSYLFFESYSKRGFQPKIDFQSENLLDLWIISKLEELNKKVTENLERFDVVFSARLLEKFVDDLSNWYIRRSRRRFQKPKDEKEKEEASQTLYYVLLKLTKLLAPFTPFISERIYQKLKKEEMPESVHLCHWPEVKENKIDLELEEKMNWVRNIVALALAERIKNKIKVRQPLKKLKIKNQQIKIEKELLELIKEEVNIKEIIFDPEIKTEIELDTEITPELKEEGLLREIIHHIQIMRKKAGFTPEDKILINYLSSSSDLKEFLKNNERTILEETKAQSFKEGKGEISFAVQDEIKIDQQQLWLAIQKI